MEFTKDDISRYYDVAEIHYRRIWNLNKSKSFHYGYWDSSTKNFHEALLNINKVLAQYARISPGDVVLDAGCGIGGSSIWLAKNIGCKVTGITLNQHQVEKANALAQKDGLQHLVTFERGDYLSTRFADESFDVVWAIESVCYADDKLDFAKEAFRLLRKGGRVVVADFYRKEGIIGKDSALVKKWTNGWAVNEFSTEEEFIEQLTQAGFSNVYVENATPAIIRSAKRLYRAYWLSIIPILIYRLIPGTSSLSRNNVQSAYLQYKTLKKGLWNYQIFSAEKE
ncbi:MAG: methyltransferase domain-containing protein [Chitinophagaceae bacterium]|nr:methyltransferase domain-containing protein [Chitinophagaceae bacterium]